MRAMVSVVIFDYYARPIKSQLDIVAQKAVLVSTDSLVDN